MKDEQQDSKGWFSRIPDIVWAPVASGGLILIVGTIALIANQPWLFPSLGPSIFLHIEQPGQPTAKFYNTVVGHLHGIVAAFIAVAVMGAGNAPPVLSTNELTLARVGAAVLALSLNMLFGFLLKASHPPAAATTLLIALGSFKATLQDALTIMMGVLIVAIFGEFLRRLRLGQVKLGSKR